MRNGLLLAGLALAGPALAYWSDEAETVVESIGRVVTPALDEEPDEPGTPDDDGTKDLAGALMRGATDNARSPTTTTATPATLSAVLNSAIAGDRIVLAPGSYGAVAMPRTVFKPAISIDASRAKLSHLKVFLSGGINWAGGTIDAPRTQDTAVWIDNATDVEVAGMTMRGPRVGIGVSRSTDVEVRDNRFDGIRSDGVNIAMSQRVRVTGNLCLNFNPVLPVYDPRGRLITDGDHPDCVQGWSRRGYPLTADVTIQDNVAIGLMQGVWFEDYGDGGYDRIIVQRNDFTLAMFQGINVNNGRGTIITGNRVRAVPGARLLAFPFPLIRPWIKASGQRITLCGNQAESYPASDPANLPCKERPAKAAEPPMEDGEL